MIICSNLSKMKNKTLPTCLEQNCRYSSGEFSNTSYGMFEAKRVKTKAFTKPYPPSCSGRGHRGLPGRSWGLCSSRNALLLEPSSPWSASLHIQTFHCDIKRSARARPPAERHFPRSHVEIFHELNLVLEMSVHRKLESMHLLKKHTCVFAKYF